MPNPNATHPNNNIISLPPGSFNHQPPPAEIPADGPAEAVPVNVDFSSMPRKKFRKLFMQLLQDNHNLAAIACQVDTALKQIQTIAVNRAGELKSSVILLPGQKRDLETLESIIRLTTSKG
jgi:hypothetical protein